MDLVRIKDRLLAAKRTSESKHYKVSIAELIGVLIDLVDEIETVNVFKGIKRKRHTIGGELPKIPPPFDGIESPPPKKWVSEKDFSQEE